MRPLIFFLLLLYWLPCHSAEDLKPLKKDYAKSLSRKDGLTSEHIYGMLQDSLGFLWCASDKGVFRFDGKNSRLYSGDNGWSNELALKVFQSADQSIWAVCEGGSIYRLRNGEERFKEHPLSKSVKRQHNQIAIRELSFKENGEPVILFFSIKEGEKIRRSRIATTSTNDGAQVHELDNRKQLYSWVEQGRRKWFLPPEANLKSTEKNALPGIFSSELFRSLDTSGIGADPALHTRNFIRSTQLFFDEKTSFLSLNNKLMMLVEGFPVRHWILGEVISTLHLAADSQIWIGQVHGGGLSILDLKNGTISQEALNGLSVSSIVSIKDGGFAVGTLENGLFIYPKYDLSSITSTDWGRGRFVTSFNIAGDQPYFITDYRYVYALDGSPKNASVNFIYESENTQRTLVKDFSSRGNMAYSLIWDSLCSDTLGANMSFRKIYANNSISIEQLTDSLIIIASNSGVGLYSNTDSKNFQTNTLFRNRVNSVCHWYGSKYLMATQLGIFVLNTKEISIKPFSLVKGQMITDIVKDDKGRIWYAGSIDGLSLIKGDSVMPCKRSIRNMPQQISTLGALGSGCLFSAASGIYRANFSGAGFELREIRHLGNDVIQGVLSIAKTGENLIIAGKRAIYVIPAYTLERSDSGIRPYIQSVSVSGRDTSVQDQYDLSNLQNDLRIRFHEVSLSGNVNSSFQYRMLGIDSTWRLIDANELQFLDLPSGSYTFELSNKTLGFPAQAESTLSFKIAPHFTETWLFRLAVLLAALVLILIVSVDLIRRSRLKQRMLESEQKALRAQMNPHFIFNAMNSIQYLIGRDDRDRAQMYLARFSRLVRFVLDNSNLSLIPVKDELESIRLYLDMEKLRFEERFTYRVRIPVYLEQNRNIKVPTMLLQPIVENAIVHGLFPKESEGSIELAVEEDSEQNLIITCRDNGIGRQASALLNEKKGRKKKSLSGTNIDERIRLYNQLTKQQIRLEIIDEKTTAGKADGTTVKLYLPKMLRLQE